MSFRRWLALIAAAAPLWAGCAARRPAPAGPERLFLAMQIEDGGEVLARPRLLGQTGTPLSMRLVDPLQPDRAKLKLDVTPVRSGDGYQVRIGLSLPGESPEVTGRLELLHGEERQLRLSSRGRPISVKLMLMRVDSPEFQALMDLARKDLLGLHQRPRVHPPT